MAPKADKFGKQIRFAERRGIPFVWFGAGYDDSVKDIRTGEQAAASPATWAAAAGGPAPRRRRHRRPEPHLPEVPRPGRQSRYDVGASCTVYAAATKGIPCSAPTTPARSAPSTLATVILAGWVAKRRDHGGVAFIDLRDASGIVQVVVRDEFLEASGAHDLRNEFCIKVTGVVEARPEGNVNPNLPTGEVEVAIRELEVLNPSAPLPFQIDERVTVGEEARLKYRYLDLRRPRRHAGHPAALRR